jgi:arginine decarboxylase
MKSVSIDPNKEENTTNTDAYQESIAGFGGIQHCLQPAPKHITIDVDENGEYYTKLFSKEQTYKSMLKILGY